MGGCDAVHVSWILKGGGGDGGGGRVLGRRTTFWAQTQTRFLCRYTNSHPTLLRLILWCCQPQIIDLDGGYSVPFVSGAVALFSSADFPST